MAHNMKFGLATLVALTVFNCAGQQPKPDSRKKAVDAAAEPGIAKPRYIIASPEPTPSPSTPPDVSPSENSTGTTPTPSASSSNQPSPTPSVKPFPHPGYTAQAIQNMYGISSQPYQGDRATICLIEAYDQSSKAINDTKAYASQFDLPTPNIQVVNIDKPSSDTVQWYVETTLDVDMVLAVAPKAKIMILVAKDATSTAIEAAVSAAPSYKCDIVSMSFGGPASPEEQSITGIYQVPGIGFFASSGDSTGIANYPALQPGVVGVGGTSVTMNGSNVTEVVWNDGVINGKAVGEGQGYSTLFPVPSYQQAVNKESGKQSVEVTAIADPNTGVAVYTDGQWIKIGGTSAAAPIWAAVMGLVYDGRRAKSLPVIRDVHKALYSGLATIAAKAYRDVTVGALTNSAGMKLKAATGYDAVSGFGSPITNEIINYLTSSSAAGVN